MTFVNLYAIVCVSFEESEVKNRHISVQILQAADEIRRQIADGWFLVDSLSDSDNDDPTQIENATLKLEFAKLNGDGISKWIVISKDGTIFNFGEFK